MFTIPYIQVPAVALNGRMLLMNLIVTSAVSMLDSRNYLSYLYKQLTTESPILLFMANLMILGFFQSPMNRAEKCSHVINLNKSTGADNLEPKRFS